MGIAYNQFRALFWKNLSLQRNQLKTTLIQLLIPFSLILLVGLVQILIDNLAEKNSDNEVEYYGPLDLTQTVPLTQDGEIDLSALYLSPPFFLFTANESIRERVGSATYLGDKSGLLSQVPQYYQAKVPIVNLPETYWPFFIAKDSEDDMLNTFIEVSRNWKLLLNDNGLGPAPDPEEYPKILNQSLIWIRNREYEELPPFGGITFYDLTDEKLEYVVTAATRYGGWESKSSSELDLSDIQMLFVDIDRRGNIINTVHNAYLKSTSQSQEVNIKTFYQGFPQTNIFRFDLSSIAGVFLYGFVSSLLLPVFIANLVTDKQEKVLLMMQMSGLKMSVYWLVAYLYDMLLYLLVVFIIYITSFLFSMRMFTQTDPVLLILFFFLWGNALIGMCFLLSTFFSKSRTASVVGYLIVIVSVIISNLLNSSVFLATKPPFWYMIYPPFAFYRGVFVFEDACIDLNCFDLSDLGNNPDVYEIFLYLFIECLVLYPVTYYLQSVLPNEFGVRRSPIFFLEPIINYFRKPKGYNPIGLEPEDGEDEREVKLNISSEMSGNRVKSLSLDGVEDEDVVEERRKVFSGDYPNNTQVVVKNIKKEYEGRYGQPKKKALHGVTFSINENECFGLLGANGAGKTTLISILTGVFSPTSGSAIVAGCDILNNMTEVQTKIGVCPQFDIFYPELTARQHLLFYGRLKGIDKTQELKEVNKILEDVGLTEVADRLSKDLSGGMRRRLSMAIAIIGNPKIVILDEPTTGLDPLTRRQIWDILLAMKINRSMILTTHSMEEADIICDRICIMSKGRMKCIGTQERLKTKFGSGYTLTVFTDPNTTDIAQDFILKNFSDMELEEAFAGTISFRVPKEKLVVSKVFEVMQFNRPEYIHDWGLSMTTLEDVFINILRMDQY